MPQNVTAVAEYHFNRIVRSRVLWLLSLPILLDGIVNVTTTQTAMQYLGNLRYIASFQRGIAICIPFACIFFGARAIAGARGAGQLQTTVLQPVSRLDVLVGKALGQTAALLLAISAVVFVGYLYGTVSGFRPPIPRTLGFEILSGVYAGALTIGMIGLSALFQRAIVPASVAFVGGATSFLFYESIVAAPLKLLYGSASGGSPAGTDGTVLASTQPDAPLGLLALVSRLPPTNAYYAFSNWALGLPNADALSLLIVFNLRPDSVSLGVTPLGPLFGDSGVPLYLHPMASVVTLVSISLVVFAVGYAVFKRSDLQQL
ncbi:uncharacterized protein HHUB_4224 (plasmid) [Halobacterium hubeiense]|uniref:ABC-type transport system permease protein n=1 Tax=Halobacterium hubeiense TaxID=1407499 RepID=A0A0U5HYD1_9EURY|nr:ABC transporter permease subunit [Halobacterium hubeiense]CQH63911.1 uncharacterized protein HHUB_4224 [Halobacterium hubeiense]